jgi:predicted nucleic acid-binding protein
MRLLDTCFLIDLQREWVRREPGPATGYLQTWREEEFAISVVSALEFLEGYGDPSDGESFLSPFRQIELTGRACRTGSRIRRVLRQRGELIGDFDILIAATAMNEDAPLVTDNTRHFQRVDGLRIEDYR